MWTDNETTLDLLGYRIQAALIRELVIDQKFLPITVGIFGDWGSGKTSIMRMIEDDLDPENAENSEIAKMLEGVAVVYFNGWLLEGYDDAKTALMGSIVDALAEHKRFGAKIKERSAKILKSIDTMRALSFGIKHIAMPYLMQHLGMHSPVPPPISLPQPSTNERTDIEVKVEKEEDSIIRSVPDAVYRDVRKFRDDFAKLLSETDIKCLVVLIDDLDRCTPERLIENIEAIKLFLSVPGTAFVIGADPRIVEHAIEYRYAQRHAEGGNQELVRDYLEKLIQLPYRLPRLSPAEVEVYMGLLYSQLLLPETDFQNLITEYSKHLRDKLHAKFDLESYFAKTPNGCGEQLIKGITYCRAAAPLLSQVLKGNPRQIKRFLNSFQIRQKLARVAGLKGVKEDVLIKLMVLEYFDYNAFQILNKAQEKAHGFPLDLKLLEDAEQESFEKLKLEELTSFVSNPNLIRWLQLEPMLHDVDLQDYFWIARDRLDASLLDTSLVSEVIRQTAGYLQGTNVAQIKLGVSQLKQMSVGEQDSVLRLLRINLRNHPKSLTSYKAIEAATEICGERAIEALIQGLEKMDTVPAGASFALSEIQKKFPNHGGLQTLITKITERNIAFKTATEIRRKTK